MGVAGHHVPVWYDESSGPSSGQVISWNPVTGRWEATDIDTSAIDTAGLATDAELAAGLATKQDTIPPGTYAEAAATTAALATKAADNAVVKLAGEQSTTATETTVAVSNKALTSNVATLTTATAHGFTVGRVVMVAGVDATFNGRVLVLSVPTATTFTYTRAAANVASAAATGTAGLVTGRKNFQGGAVFASPRAINLQSYGVTAEGTVNTALPQLIADAAATGAEAVIDAVGALQYYWTLTTGIPLPKSPGLRIAGPEKYGAQIVATSLGAGVPMLYWPNDVAGHVADQTIANLYLRRSNTDGPVIEFLQSLTWPGYPGGDRRLGDRWKGTIENVVVQGLSAGTYPLIHIEQILHGRIINAWFYGGAGDGGIGLFLEGGSDAHIEDYKTPLKSNAPRTGVKITAGGGHMTTGVIRTEGTGWGGASLHLNDVINSEFRLSTEGTGEDASILLENSHGNRFPNPILGYPDQSGSGKPRAIKLVASSGNTFAGGLVGDWSDLKDDVRLATVAALPANTRSTNVLTASANGALSTIDGVAPALNNRILVKNEATGANNGIYTVTDLGSAGTPWTMTRATDADTSAEVTSGMSLLVQEGSTLAHTRWNLTTADSITLNTTALTFTQVGGVVSPFTAGDGTGGKIIDFDANSHFNTVEDMIVQAGINPIRQVVNAGRGNKCRLLVAGTNSPTHQPQSFGYPVRHRRRSGKWTPLAGPASASISSLANGRLFYMPIDFENDSTIDRIGIGITVAGSAGAVLRPAIYADDGTNWPGALLLDVGTLGGTGTGVIDGTVVSSNNGLVVSQVTGIGRIWLGIALQGAPATLPTVRTRGTVFVDDTIPVFAQGDVGYGALYQDGVTAAMPSVAAPTSGTSANVPLIQIRT